jgi:hypothetical protein
MYMQNKLNQKLEQEIKVLISDTSCFKCYGKDIVKVDKISIRLDEDYADNLSTEIAFTGLADFSFRHNDGNLISTPPPITFNSTAEIDNFEVTKVKTPISIL